jgi:hypothetical protein
MSGVEARLRAKIWSHRLPLDKPLDTLGALSLSKRLGAQTHSTPAQGHPEPVERMSLSNGQAGSYRRNNGAKRIHGGVSVSAT